MSKLLPLSLRDVAPGPSFSKAILPLSPKGLPEGCHTGGPWVEYDTGDYWKPLDCRPFINADYLAMTGEASILEAVTGIPGFPKNWRIETRNGRDWLVRPRSKMLPADDAPTLVEVLELERGLIEFNRLGYLINDPLVVGRDPFGQLFFVDLSCASKSGCGRWHEEHEFMYWLKSLPGDDLRKLYALRRHAHFESANLQRANLVGAEMGDAVLHYADLRGADLRGVNLHFAMMSGVNLIGANLDCIMGETCRGMVKVEIPVVENIDRAILAAIAIEGNGLNVDRFHTSKTVHSRAGWAVVLAGANPRHPHPCPRGSNWACSWLECQVGTHAAAALIYAKSRPDMPVPDWFASHEATMADLRACAGVAS